MHGPRKAKPGAFLFRPEEGSNRLFCAVGRISRPISAKGITTSYDQRLTVFARTPSECAAAFRFVCAVLNIRTARLFDSMHRIGTE